MDFIDGVSLRDMVKQRGALPEAEALAYIRQAAAALECVHSHNLLHLDVKPGNIMVERNVKLIDFGASKYYDAATGENTVTLLGLNTPGYAPVEQMTGATGSFSPATDVYALGATLYFLLTGITPPASVSMMSGNVTLEPLPESISRSTVKAISAAMSHRIDERPASARSFVEMLDGTESQVTDDTVLAEAPKKSNSSMEVGVGLGVALMFVIAAILYFANTGSSNDSKNDSKETATEVVADTAAVTPSVAEKEISGVTFENVTVGEAG